MGVATAASIAWDWGIGLDHNVDEAGAPPQPLVVAHQSRRQLLCSPIPQRGPVGPPRSIAPAASKHRREKSDSLPS